jgi:hypothetical protein
LRYLSVAHQIPWRVAKKKCGKPPVGRATLNTWSGYEVCNRVHVTVTADFLWAGYISAVSERQAVRAAAWSMAIAVVSGVIAIHYVHAPVLLVSLASGSFVGTYLSVVSESGKAIRYRLVPREIGQVSGSGKSNQPRLRPSRRRRHHFVRLGLGRQEAL